jgi:hypothetical protein
MDGSKDDPDMSKTKSAHLDKPKKTKKMRRKYILVEENEPLLDLSSIASLSPINKSLINDTKSHSKKHTSKNPCLNIDKMKQQMKESRQMYDREVQACENWNHEDFINRYFNKDTFTHKDLLVCIMDYYKELRVANDMLVFTFQDFINKFPRDKRVGKINFKKQHVFEAICRLLLLYNYDEGELGRQKTFFSSLEDIINGKNENITDKIISMDINIGSKGGLADIIFKTNVVNVDENDAKKWACETTYDEKNEYKRKSAEDTYIMIQNKYYDIEKTNLGDYDVTRMYALADLNRKNSKKFDGTTNIVLMVNNEDALSQKLKLAKQQYPDLIYNIYGITNKLDIWFQFMLYELKNSNNIETFLKNKGHSPSLKPSLKQRFHQLLITRTTNEYLKDGYKKFIWGAVPRSGKSYMIGGLISLRNIKHNLDNNIVLILGAKTETQGQFVEMFAKFEDFQGYKVVCPGIKDMEKEGEKNIYLFSQEYLKDKLKTTIVNKKIIQDETHFNEEFKFKKLLNCGKKIDLYFDEIHKGGSTDNSESILYAFKNICKGQKEKDERYSIIDLFVMVTATFAKPSIKYEENFIDNKPNSVIIQWSYDDQQNMKTVNNDTKMHMMINSRTGIEAKVMTEIFDEYKDIYGHPYLSVLSNEYKKHPELVLISPFLIQTETPNNPLTNTDDVRHVFQNLKCDACVSGQPIEYYKDPKHIFQDEGPVTDLLNYIHGSIYNYFHKELNYPISSPHSELWFLPDKDLYGNNDCKTKCSEVDIEDNQDEEAQLTKKNTEKKTGIPNIEPLSRGLAIKITKNINFNRYNVLIVHNTKLTYMTKKMKGADLFTSERIKLFEANKEQGLSDQIKEFEQRTYRAGNSLIILTGAKLRLGISLPCVDIAFNFDNISSVDNNYQTMFRVLTERETPTPKKYGYYLDFNKGRAITFLYEYNKNYGAARKSSSVKENVEALQSLLFTFNYNGLNLTKLDTKNELKIYNNLIEKLKTTDGLSLNEQSYVKYWTRQKNVETLIKKSLALTGNMEILNRLSKLLDAQLTIQKPPIKEKLKEGEKQKPLGKYEPGEQEEDRENMKEEEQQEASEEEEDDIDNYSDIINKIASELPSIVVLLSLFSNETNSRCDNLLDCLQLSKQKIQDFAELCNCTNIDKANIFDCFLNSPGNSVYNKQTNEYNYRYSRKHLVEILDIIISILNNPENELLYTNLDFIFDNIKRIMPKDDNLISGMELQDIEEKIKQYLSVKDEEKDKFGEVFTPKTLIDEMLNKLPPSVWKDPTLKWLDPANGIGNFPMVVYKRLMDSLPPSSNKQDCKYSGSKEKSEHILTKMLYMCEINSKNVTISKQIFGSNANICCCDFLNEEEKWRKQFKMEKETDKFDIIIGNPPFQPEKTEDDKRSGSHGVKILWDKFIKKSLELIINGGFLGFITPPPWRKPESELYKLMTKDNQLIYLHIYNKKQGDELFHVSQRVDLYVIEKKQKYKNTEIIDEQGDKIELDLSKWAFLPNYAYKNIKKIMTNEEDGITVIYDTTYHTQKPHIKATSTEKYKYPIVHSINQHGLVFWYTDDKTKGHFGVSKVLLNFNENQYPVNDYEGKYGMSQITFGIPITSKKQGDDIVKAINTDEFKEIVKATKWGAFQTDWRMFKYFRPDFYKDFTGKSSSAKIMGLDTVNERQTKPKKIAYTRTKKGGAKTGKKRTRKNKGSAWKLW